jgi:hypothetical protein
MTRESSTRATEGVGFEPTVRFPVRLISSQVTAPLSEVLPGQIDAVTSTEKREKSCFNGQTPVA